MSLRTDVEYILDEQYDTSEWGIDKSPSEVLLRPRVFHAQHRIVLFLREKFEDKNIKFEKIVCVDDSLISHDNEYWTVYKFSRDGDDQFLKFYGYYEYGFGISYSNRVWTKPVEVVTIEYEDE